MFKSPVGPRLAGLCSRSYCWPCSWPPVSCRPGALPASEVEADAEATPVPVEAAPDTAPDAEPSADAMPAADTDSDDSTELTAAEPVPAAEPEPVLVYSLSPAANVRAGPGTDHAMVFQVNAGSELTVLGRNADGTWLHIGFAEQSGWIYRPLTDIDSDILAALPIIDPATESVEAAEPAPPANMESGNTANPAADTLQVTGTTVNLRGGPDTAYPIVGQGLQ